MRLTSVLFLQNFARRGACKLFVDEDCFDGKAVRYVQVDELETYMHRYATFFCDACLQGEWGLLLSHSDTLRCPLHQLFSFHEITSDNLSN